MNNEITQFVTKKALSESLGLSPDTFKKYRLSGIWLEGIHWQRLNSRCVLYNLPLLKDWIANRSEPTAHERAIHNYLISLPSNKSKVRGRRAS